MNYFKLGAVPLEGGRGAFRVWAPRAQRVEVRLIGPRERVVPLARTPAGYFHGVLEAVEPGSRYYYRLDGARDRPDPASRFQPEGVHGPSQVVDPAYPWTDWGWCGLGLRDYVIYELHVGAFTPEGTFGAIVPHLQELKDLGITAVELLPVAQFPGARNWGHDGVFPFAAQNSYGGPEGLKGLVNACHGLGLAVILDVVYNHLGPEGNYLSDFGDYFTDRYRTPWGEAVNFDGPGSDEVRRFFIDSALYWVEDCHIDALRLDALHAIFDNSPRPFLAELARKVHQRAEALGRRVYLMAESDLNDVRLIRPPEAGGCGLDAHWNEDFHHALHTLLTGETQGYYLDFGRPRQLAKAFGEGFVYSGQYSPYRRRRHGSSSQGVEPHRLVVFAQNHDQVGNRLQGDRLTQTLSSEALKLAAGVVILSPFLPLLFMGEEYGETAPFQYFVSHQDPALVDAVRRGRQREFAAFGWQTEPPDPFDEETFRRCKLNQGLKQEGQHRVLWEFYRELLRLRREILTAPVFGPPDQEVSLHEKEQVLCVQRAGAEQHIILLANFSPAQVASSLPWPPGPWEKLADSAERRWGGPGSRIPLMFESDGGISLSLAPHSFSLFRQSQPEA